MIRIAVVQPALALGEVERNLARIEDLIRDAHREHAPDVIVVPEGLTSPNVYARVMRDAPRPVDGQPMQMLTRLARELDCVLAGGFLAVRGAHAYGTYVLAEPDGAAASARQGHPDRLGAALLPRRRRRRRHALRRRSAAPSG